MRVAEADAAKLEILLEERLVVVGEVSVVGLVDHLGHPYHVARGVLLRGGRRRGGLICEIDAKMA